jgi:3-dehydroquinate synthase
VGRGTLSLLPRILAAGGHRRAVVITDQRIEPLYGARVTAELEAAGHDPLLLTHPCGDDAKSLASLGRLYDAALADGIERDDAVVALGGGVVGDLAGFFAATFLRGLPVVQVPTSLVAMVTASVGGKVGVNHAGVKNLIGAFHQPVAVVVDVDTLATLPPREHRSGLGELVTVGVLGAPEVFEALEAPDPPDLVPLVEAAVRCKQQLVEADPLDRLDIRAKLNLGHTFGHALESLSGYQLSHGEAVAIGLGIATRLAARLGRCDPGLPERVRRVLRRHDLPTTVEGPQPWEVLAAMRSDKKRRGGRLRWIVPEAIGRVAIVDESEVPPGLLREVLADTLGGGLP